MLCSVRFCTYYGVPGVVQFELKCAVKKGRVVGVGRGRHGLEAGIRSAVSETKDAGGVNPSVQHFPDRRQDFAKEMEGN